MKSIRLITVLALLNCLAACPRPWTLTLCNNTQENLTIRLKDRDVAWRSGTCMPIDKDKLRWGGTSAAYTPRVLDVLHPKGHRAYSIDIFPLPPPFAPEYGPVDVALQLEPDGYLYAIPPDQSVPAQQILAQPAKFPLKPTASGSS